jgi:predicted regulator of Ras-like GTPase activity (Roadblock/LC7/MglB family)
MATRYAQLESIVNELQSKDQVDSAAIIRRDGVLMASNLPADFKEKDVFAMMSATILGAAWNISIEHALGSPSRIIVETDDGNIVISEAGTKALLVCFVSREFITSELQDSLTAYENRVKSLL